MRLSWRVTNANVDSVVFQAAVEKLLILAIR